jgi:aminomethyltransferase
VDFAGWEMPVQYAGILAEHRAVRERAGLFDVSHMGEIEVRGPGALAACQWLTTNDLTRIDDGAAQYTLLCQPDGGVVDDVIVYRLAGDRFLFCVNASNRAADFAWMREHSPGVDLIDRSDELAQLALQGPRATEILARLTRLPLAEVRSFRFVSGAVGGSDALVARTGYTGEDGWELYVPAAGARALWDDLLAAGSPDGLEPAGLGARDTLRLESALPLYGHELDRTTTPLEAGLDRFVVLDGEDFLGRSALLTQRASGPTRRLVGLSLLEPGIAREGHVVQRDGVRVGRVTSGTRSPTLGRSIALAFVTPECTAVGTAMTVEIRGRAVAATVVPLPFYRRTKKGAAADLPNGRVDA